MNVVLRRYTNFALDALLVLSISATLFSSYVVWFVLPHGIGLHGASGHCGGGGVGSTGNVNLFLGLRRCTWITVHNWAAVVLFVIIMTHIILHWSWILETTKRISSHLFKSRRKVMELYGAALILFILFVFECLSGLVLWLVLPRGVGDYYRMIQGTGRTFLALQRNVWVDLHAWIAVTILAIIIVHLVLNWNWVVGVSKRIFWGALRPAR
jgi:hypothetical protein